MRERHTTCAPDWRLPSSGTNRGSARLRSPSRCARTLTAWSIASLTSHPGTGDAAIYVDVEIGAAVQNLALSATDRGLAGVIVGGFDDAVVADILELGALEPRLLFSLGQPG